MRKYIGIAALTLFIAGTSFADTSATPREEWALNLEIRFMQPAFESRESFFRDLTQLIPDAVVEGEPVLYQSVTDISAELVLSENRENLDFSKVSSTLGCVRPGSTLSCLQFFRRIHSYLLNDELFAVYLKTLERGEELLVPATFLKQNITIKTEKDLESLRSLISSYQEKLSAQLPDLDSNDLVTVTRRMNWKK